MTRLRAPKVTVTAVPVFTSVELSELDKACQGRSFAARRDAAIIAVFTATGIRLSELTGICCHPGDPARSDLDLHDREIRIRGKGGTARTVKISHQAARSLDRYLRARARHPQSWRPQLWLGVNSRGPLTATGIYQVVACRGRQCGVDVYPHRFRHHFSHTWLDRGGAERDLMELNGWTSPQMLTRYGASARGARARRSYDRIMDDST
jgi:site-specific recombinase XerD